MLRVLLIRILNTYSNIRKKLYSEYVLNCIYFFNLLLYTHITCLAVSFENCYLSYIELNLQMNSRTYFKLVNEGMKNYIYPLRKKKKKNKIDLGTSLFRGGRKYTAGTTRARAIYQIIFRS